MMLAAVLRPTKHLSDPADMLDLGTGGSDELSAIQNAVGGYVEVLDLTGSLVMWVHDEARLVGAMPNMAATTARLATGRRGLIFGTAVITAHDGAGNTVDLPDDWRDQLAAVASGLTRLPKGGVL